MRRKYFGLALAAIATLTPASAFAGDREIAEQIIQNLKADRDAGNLKDFTLDMKVDAGVVLFRGNVSADQQKQIVLAAADGVEGIAKVVDQVSVTAKSADQPSLMKPKSKVAKPAKADDSFSFREALAQTAEAIRRKEAKSAADAAKPVADEAKAVVAKAEPAAEKVEPVVLKAEPIAEEAEPVADEAKVAASERTLPMPGEIQQTGSVEPVANADNITKQNVISSISNAQQAGKLKGFKVNVTSADGIIELVGKASSEAQRDLLVQLAQQTPGVRGVHESIEILTKVRPVSNLQNLKLQPTGSAAPAPIKSAPYRKNQGATQGTPATQASTGAPMGAPVMGAPVPMAPYGGAATPRYEQPYLPNYAWPGYAAYPNYAAVNYPQQYSPSAFPYIGPFYPYPQVPLGWRKVSLEWDDGWWYLDFTDR